MSILGVLGFDPNKIVDNAFNKAGSLEGKSSEDTKQILAQAMAQELATANEIVDHAASVVIQPVVDAIDRILAKVSEIESNIGQRLDAGVPIRIGGHD